MRKHSEVVPLHTLDTIYKQGVSASEVHVAACGVDIQMWGNLLTHDTATADNKRQQQ